MSEALEETTKQTKSRSLAATLAIAFVALSVVTLLVVSSLQLYFNFQSQQDVVVGEQRLIAQEAANEVALFVQERFGELESAAEFSNLLDASVDEAEQALEQLLGAEQVFRQAALLDKQDEVVVTASRLSQLAGKEVANQLEADALSQIRQDGRYISPVYIDDETFEPLVVMAVPILDIFGDHQGALVAEANLKFMWDLVNRLEIGDEGEAYVIDRQGNLLAFGDVTRVIAGENLSQLEEVAEFVNRDASEVEIEEADVDITTGINGTNVLATYVPLGVPDWAVVTELPVSEAYRGVIKNVAIFAAIIVIAAVLAGGVGAYLARRLAAPVQQLTDITAQIAEGDLSLQAKAEGPTEVRRLAGAFNNMTGRINELVHSLEDRVAARTQRLELVAEMSEQLSSILNVEQLMAALVSQVKDQFDYYHAHVYILDNSRQNLVMTAGAGEAGQTMKAKGHNIRYDAPTSLVARAARTGQIVWVDNVREAADWLPNPLLPDTYSEMAVPIILEDQVVGVLDVQQNTIGGLDEGDASVLRSLANQVAVAIRNARLFAEVEAALAEARTAQEKYIADAWQRTNILSKSSRYLYTSSDIVQLDEEKQNMLVETHRQALEQENPTVLEGEEKAIVAPIRLGQQKIGALQIHNPHSHSVSEDDLAIVEAIIDQFAQTAENLRLFDETRQQAGREQIIREITDKMRRVTSLEELVKIAAEELGQKLSAGHAIIDLGFETIKGGKESGVSSNGNRQPGLEMEESS